MVRANIRSKPNQKEMPPDRVTRPLNNQKRKPVKFKSDEEPQIKKQNPEVDPEFVRDLSRYLLPITVEEVLNRELGESPIIKAIGTTVATGGLGFMIGAGKYMFETLPQQDAIFSIKSLSYEGIKFGAYLGIQSGITDLIETSMSCARGKAMFYDKVVAGAMAGAIIGLPNGIDGVKKGAARGALLATGMALMQMTQDIL